ncbi:MAG: FAD-dependent oxidoreductase [Armatimonadetes bacterium]|nr:FAD-dependent oxidoreductase [Armatimonadota bacterium]
MSKAYDLVVLGGGPAGLVLTLGAASLGARVALIEKHKLGGDCLNYGCVPSKALLRAAHVAHTARQAKRFGVDTGEVSVNLGRVMDYVQSRIDTIGVHDRPENFEKAGAEVIFGSPSFRDGRSLEVDGRVLPFKNCAICTGTAPFVPPAARRVPHHTNETIFGVRELPGRLLVLGGGPIACELSQGFARFGSKVTLVVRGDRILKREDPEAAQVVLGRFRKEGIDLRTGLDLESVPASGKGGFQRA